jgi:hypothetical protein
MPLCTHDAGAKVARHARAQLYQELTNVVMASPRSLQVSPLVCCHHAVPLCCSLVAVVSQLLRDQNNDKCNHGCRHPNTKGWEFPGFGRIHFYEAPTEFGFLLREALWADASGLVWSGENTTAKRGCARATSRVVGHEEGETLDVAKREGSHQNPPAGLPRT